MNLFFYIEQWDESERGDAARNENGFLDLLEKHRTQWTDVLKAINPKAAELHAAADVDWRDIADGVDATTRREEALVHYQEAESGFDAGGCSANICVDGLARVLFV